jgi:hypothetical protein
VMCVKWKLVSVCLEIVLILALDRCTVCTECTTTWKSIWEHSKVDLGDVGQAEAHFGPFADSVNLDARYVYGLRQTYHGSKLILYTRDCTPR